eukprot:1155010-Pelagomonas_calceolata.AAC.3
MQQALWQAATPSPFAHAVTFPLLPCSQARIALASCQAVPVSPCPTSSSILTQILYQHPPPLAMQSRDKRLGKLPKLPCLTLSHLVLNFDSDPVPAPPPTSCRAVTRQAPWQVAKASRSHSVPPHPQFRLRSCTNTPPTSCHAVTQEALRQASRGRLCSSQGQKQEAQFGAAQRQQAQEEAEALDNWA